MTWKNAKKTAVAAAIIVSVCFASPLVAQERAGQAESPTLGLGVSLILDVVENLIDRLTVRLADDRQGANESRDVGEHSETQDQCDPVGGCSS